MTPYEAPLVMKILRNMPAPQLAAVTSRDFQRWPAAVVLNGRVLSEIISNERARRK